MRRESLKRYRFLAVLLCMLLVLCSCGGKDVEEEETREGRKKSNKTENQEVVENLADDTEKGTGSEESSTTETEPETAGSEEPTVKEPLVVNVETVPCTDEYMESLNFSASYDRLVVENDGYEQLKAGITEINDEMEMYLLWNLDSCTSSIASMIEDAEPGTYDNWAFSLDHIAQVVRADEQIVSIRCVENSYMGGAHPYWYAESHNLNTVTGEELSLHDIMADDAAYYDLYNALVAVLTEYSNSSRDNKLDPGYEDTVAEYFFTEDVEPTWYYTEDALQFEFDPYILAPYASGSIEVEVPLEGLRLAELSTVIKPREPAEVHVSTVDELFNAFADNTRIYLAPGVYDLSEWIEQLQYTPYNRHADVYWGALNIFGAANLELVAENPKLTTQIVTQYSSEDVITFECCRNLVLDGLTLGHTVEPGSCSGDVLEFNKCKNITLRNMDLYGCGAYGITAYNCTNIETTDSVIHDCTYGILYMAGCEDVLFKDSMFTYCKEYNLLDGSGSYLVFENCIFDKNEGDFLPDNWYYDHPTYFVFKNCQFLSGEDASFEENKEYVTVTQD